MTTMSKSRAFAFAIGDVVHKYGVGHNYYVLKVGRGVIVKKFRDVAFYVFVMYLLVQQPDI